MAASAASFQQKRGIQRMLIVAGNGHIRHGFGIPLRTARLTGGRVLTIGVETGEFAQTTERSCDFEIFVSPP